MDSQNKRRQAKTPSDSRRRDPEDRVVKSADQKAKREKMLDKTIADSFPASDPPSSLPDPSEDSFRPGWKTEKRENKRISLSVSMKSPCKGYPCVNHVETASES